MNRIDDILSVRGLIPPAIGDFNRHRGRFVFYGILFGVFNALVLVPTFTFLLVVIVRWGGGRVLTNEEVFEFFLSPIGVMATVVLIATVLTSLMTQQAGLMIIFASLRTRKQIGSVRALLAMLSKLPGILLINLLRAVILLLVLLPFAGVGVLLYGRFLAGYDLNYLVQVRPPAFWAGVAVAIVLILPAVFCLLIAHTRVIFSFPAYFFGGRSPAAALRQSFSLATGYTLRLVWVIVVWLAMVGVINLVLGIVLDRLGPLVLPLAGQSLTVVALVIGLVLAVQALAHGAVNIFTFGINAIMIARAYIVLSADEQFAIPERTEAMDSHHRQMLWAVGTVAGVVLVGGGLTAAGLLENLNLEDAVVIAAHRGDSKHAPENTLAAIERAIEAGADYVELDVQETADGTVVVLHDSDLKRIAGRDEKIWEVTYEEIRDLDVGSWFAPEFADQRIPTLAEVIARVGRRVPLIIEIKLNGREQHFVENVVRMIEQAGIADHCIVASLTGSALAEVATLNPQLKRASLVYQTVGDMSRIDAGYLMVESGLATSLAVKSAHDGGKQIFVWTVNDPTTMSFLIDRGVDGILTDDPALLAEVLEQRAGLTDFERVALRFAEIVSR